jgi:hypothetical protein
VIAAITAIAEHRIREAMKHGEFDDLPCKGKPLDLEADANIPPELRMAYTLLKNGGYLDDGEGVVELKEVASLEGMLGYNPEERRKVRQILKLNVMEFRINRQSGRKLDIESDGYYEKVVERISVKGKEAEG